MLVRAAHSASIRVIRGGKKEIHSPTFVKFEIFVFKKELSDSCEPCYLGTYWSTPQRILTPNNPISIVYKEYLYVEIYILAIIKEASHWTNLLYYIAEEIFQRLRLRDDIYGRSNRRAKSARKW